MRTSFGANKHLLSFYWKTETGSTANDTVNVVRRALCLSGTCNLEWEKKNVNSMKMPWPRLSILFSVDKEEICLGKAFNCVSHGQLSKIFNVKWHPFFSTSIFNRLSILISGR